MENREQVREFLTTRRAKVSPSDVGLTAGTNRRVAGLRRSEVATLAGVSIEYYAKLERGDLRGVSESVLDAIATALRLDDAERTHLVDLARSANASPLARPRRAKRTLPATLQMTLDAITAGPAFVSNGRQDLLMVNALGRAFFSELYIASGDPPNFSRFEFLDTERSKRFYDDWERAGDVNVAMLRIEAGRDPHNKELHDLIGELSTRSEDFRARWARHDVRRHTTGVKTFTHPVVGGLTLHYSVLDVVGEPGLTMTVYTAEPGSASADNLKLLASWAADSGHTDEPAVPAAAPRDDLEPWR